MTSCLQEEAIKKKYGGMLPKKPPLISKVTTLFLWSYLFIACHNIDALS